MKLYLPQEYAELTDDELLHLAADRSSLTDEAKFVLDAEMRDRNLKAGDIAKNEHFVKKRGQIETKRRNRKLFGTRQNRFTWINKILVTSGASVVISLILMAYLALPEQFRLPTNWQEAALYVMFSSVFIMFGGASFWRRNGFWLILLISSSAHAAILHAWITRFGTLDGSQVTGKQEFAVLLGPVLFLVVYGVGFQIRRNFYGKSVNNRNK